MRITNLAALLAVCALSMGALGCRGTNKSQPPIHLNPNMDFQKRFDAQEPNDFYADKRSMRPQPTGTIARGALADDPHLHDGRMPDGSYATTIPAGISWGADLIDRGQDRYDIFCAPCHDRAGTSKGIIVERSGGAFLGLPSLHDGRIKQQQVGQLYESIKNGRGRMPGYDKQIPVEDRWAIVAYVRALQLATESDLPAKK